MIDPPRHGEDHPDRLIDCEVALEDRLIALADEAQAAGWSRDEAWYALLSLAANHIEANLENDKVEREIRTARILSLIFPDGIPPRQV